MTHSNDAPHSAGSAAADRPAIPTTDTTTTVGAATPRGPALTLVRIGELSEMLGVPHWTLRRYADAGQIPVIRATGQQRRFDPDRVRTALAQLERAGADTTPSATPGDHRDRKPPTGDTAADAVPGGSDATAAGSVESHPDRAPVPGQITPAPTEPTTQPTWERDYQLTGLEEDLVWRDAVVGADIDTDTSASRLLEYSLEEMVNNAIDHSGGTGVTVRIWSTQNMLAFQVADNGEGAFAHLRKGLGLEDDFDAIATLTKGKQTTWRERHSGEGIFFTSKMVDIFRITANSKTWTVDNPREDQSVGIVGDTVGTRVYGEVDPNTTRTSSEVFARFIDNDYAFNRTRPSVKLASLGLRFASRSEARRLMAGLGEFTEIDIDFAGVSEVGQGFIDEVFRVWANNHQDKALNPINMNPAVEFMVHRGLARA